MGRYIRRTPVSIHSRKRLTFDQPGDHQVGDEAIIYFHGTLEWSAQFDRYIRHVLPKQIEEVRRAWKEWWTDEYVCSRLRFYMGDERASVAIKISSGQASYHELAKEHRHTVWWVDKQRRIAYRLVRSLWLQYELPRRNRAVQYDNRVLVETHPSRTGTEN